MCDSGSIEDTIRIVAFAWPSTMRKERNGEVSNDEVATQSRFHRDMLDGESVDSKLLTLYLRPNFQLATVFLLTSRSQRPALRDSVHAASKRDLCVYGFVVSGAFSVLWIVDSDVGEA